MEPAVNLTGRWVGHYLQRDQQRPIMADLVQTGRCLSGTMRDGHLEGDCSVFEAAFHAGLPPGADEQIVAQIRALVPDARSGPVRCVHQLPPDSVLEGWCDGRTVYFLKTYQGISFSGYQVGDRRLGVEKADHAVHYEGQLSPDGLRIEGRWSIDPDPYLRTRRMEGLFTLSRLAATHTDAADEAVVAGIEAASSSSAGRSEGRTTS
jgi:hypothetical protein